MTQRRKPVNSDASLIVPVYLNQRIVFDLVAMLQGGISTVTRVSETNQDRLSTENRVQAGFGLADAFASLMKIDLSTGQNKLTGNETARSSEEERVHTPPSLFFVLRNILVEKGLVKEIDDADLAPGAFVEFRTTLSVNPVIGMLDAIRQIMDMALIFSEPDKSASGKHSRNQGGRKKPPYNPVLEKIDKLREMLRSGNTTDLTTQPLTSGHRSVITAETQYLTDDSMGDLVDGTFTVFGKVTRLICTGEGSINLVRKTALGRLRVDMLEEAFKELNSLPSTENISLPKIEWEIKAPVVQILPIAIFA